MFESLENAVRTHREAGLDHHHARDHRDDLGMDTAVDQLRTIAAFLRAAGHPELIHPLTMEWVTEGRDDNAHAHYRDLVDKLLAAAH